MSILKINCKFLIGARKHITYKAFVKKIVDNHIIQYVFIGTNIAVNTMYQKVLN